MWSQKFWRTVGPAQVPRSAGLILRSIFSPLPPLCSQSQCQTPSIRQEIPRVPPYDRRPRQCPAPQPRSRPHEHPRDLIQEACKSWVREPRRLQSVICVSQKKRSPHSPCPSSYMTKYERARILGTRALQVRPKGLHAACACFRPSSAFCSQSAITKASQQAMPLNSVAESRFP
jgi:hypothetical protein